MHCVKNPTSFGDNVVIRLYRLTIRPNVKDTFGQCFVLQARRASKHNPFYTFMTATNNFACTILTPPGKVCSNVLRIPAYAAKLSSAAGTHSNQWCLLCCLTLKTTLPNRKEAADICPIIYGQ